jgi:hypothetical protein
LRIKTIQHDEKYSVDNPQPMPSQLLADYMRANNVDKHMTFEEGRDWFAELRAALTVDAKPEKEYRYRGR